MPRKKTLDQLLAAAKLPRRALTVCLRGDLVAEYQRLVDQLDQFNEEKAKQGQRLAGPKSKKGAEIAQQIEAVRAKMREESLELTLEALPGSEWRALKGEYPMPQDPSPTDLVVRAEARPLFNAAVPKSIVEPEMTDEQWERLDQALPDGEFQRLVDAVYDLNEGAVVVPKSLAAFTTLRMSDGD